MRLTAWASDLWSRKPQPGPRLSIVYKRHSTVIILIILNILIIIFWMFFTNLNICLQLCIYLYSIATSARHFSTLPPCTNERKQLWVFFFSFLSILLYLLLDSGNRCYECLLTHTHTTNNGPAARTVGAWPFLFLLMIIYCRYWIQIDECNEQPTSQRRTWTTGTMGMANGYYIG